MSNLTDLDNDDHTQYGAAFWAQVPLDISCEECNGTLVTDGETEEQLRNAYVWIKAGRLPRCQACAQTGRVPIPFSEVWGL